MSPQWGTNGMKLMGSYASEDCVRNELPGLLLSVAVAVFKNVIGGSRQRQDARASWR